MLNIQFLPANCGDAIIVKWKESATQAYLIVIDFGKERSKNHPILVDHLKIAVKEIGKIDLFVGTHMDDDHIGGILKLFNNNHSEIIEKVVEWWLNHSLEIENNDTSDQKINGKQNIDLKEFLTMKELCPLHPILKDHLKTIGGAKIQVLSPNKEGYEKAKNISLKEEIKRSTLIGAKIPDHNLSIEELKHKPFYEDGSETNNSSIAFLFSLSKIKGLFLADAFPSTVLKSLNELGYNDSDKKLELDFVKISHHGSKNNTSEELLDVLECCNYIICCNGYNGYSFPDKEALVKIILKGTKEKPVNIYFTHSDDALQQIFTIEEQNNEDYHFNLSFGYPDEILNFNFPIHE